MQASTATVMLSCCIVLFLVCALSADVHAQGADDLPLLASGEPTCIWTPASAGDTVVGRCSVNLLFGAVPLPPEGLGGRALAGIAYLAGQCAQHGNSSACTADTANTCTWSAARSACQLAGDETGLASVLSLQLACNGSAAADTWRCSLLGTAPEQCTKLPGCSASMATSTSDAASSSNITTCTAVTDSVNTSTPAALASYNASAWGECRGADFFRAAADVCAVHGPDAAACDADGRCRWQPLTASSPANANSSTHSNASHGNSSSAQMANTTGTAGANNGSCTFTDETLVSVVLSDANLAPGADDFTLQYQDAMHSCSAVSSAVACQSYGTFFGELSHLQQYASAINGLTGRPPAEAAAARESGTGGNATAPFCGDGVCSVNETCQACLQGNCSVNATSSAGQLNSSVPCAADCGWCSDPAFTDHLAQLSHIKVHHHDIPAIASPGCACREASAFCKGDTRFTLFNFTLPADFDSSVQCYVEVEVSGSYEIRSAAGRTTVLLLGSSNSSSSSNSDGSSGIGTTSSPLEVLLLAGAYPAHPQSNGTAGQGPFWPAARQGTGTASTWFRGQTAVPCSAGVWQSGAQEVAVAVESPCIDWSDVAVHVQLWWANGTFNATDGNSTGSSGSSSQDSSAGGDASSSTNSTSTDSSPAPQEPALPTPDDTMPSPAVPSPAAPAPAGQPPQPPQPPPVPAPREPAAQHSRAGPQAQGSPEAGAAAAASAGGGSSGSAAWGILWTMAALVTVAGVGFVAYQRYGQQWMARRYRSLNRGRHKSALHEGLRGGDIEMEAYS